MKKVLILGGKPIGSIELVEYAKRQGYYTIVSDYLPVDQSPAKRISDESWDFSTADVVKIAEKSRKCGVSAVLTGVHEFNIERKIELAEVLGLPTYCTIQQWRNCENKAFFKTWCSKFGIDIARTYSLSDIERGLIEYPVVVKPLDGSGSRGFSICSDKAALSHGVEQARMFSPSGEILIEEYVDSESAIVHYTAIDGKIVFCGMSDKHSQPFENGVRVMALQTFPSMYVSRYLAEVDAKVRQMLVEMGIRDGPFWIEVFIDLRHRRFVVNEAGYRFGGSLTNYPVKFLYGIDQLELMFAHALRKRIDSPIPEKWRPAKPYYCILPIHLKPGRIISISGVEKIRQSADVPGWAQVHFEGDRIEDWGTAQQVFAYLHLAYFNRAELKMLVERALSMLSVLDENANNMLYCLFDISKI